MTSVNAVFAFAVEMAALYAWGLLAWTLPRQPVAGALAAATAVALFAVLWGRFAAPRSSRRLQGPALAVFKLAIFAVSAAALWAAGQSRAGLVLGVAGAVQIALALAIGEL